MLPYIRPSSIRRFFEDRQIESTNSAVSAILSANVMDTGKRNVLVAHQYVAHRGSEPVLSESEIRPVGGTDAVDPALFHGFDYVALGHLHCPQYVSSSNIRYSGSPLKYSFDERHHEKAIIIADIGPKGSAVDIKSIPLAPMRDVREIRGPISELTDERIIDSGGREDYIHAIVTDDEAVFDAIGRIRSIYPRSVLSFDNSRTKAQTDFSAAARPSGKSPLELFCELYAEQNGKPPTAKQSGIIGGLIGGEDGAP
jgi:exonuclease SbcD